LFYLYNCDSTFVFVGLVFKICYNLVFGICFELFDGDIVY
jgi:hypothetical protein